MVLDEERFRKLIPHVNEVLARWRLPYCTQEVNSMIKSYMLSCVRYTNVKEKYNATRISKLLEVSSTINYDGTIYTIRILTQFKSHDVGTAAFHIIKRMEELIPIYQDVNGVDYGKIENIIFP